MGSLKCYLTLSFRFFWTMFHFFPFITVCCKTLSLNENVAKPSQNPRLKMKTSHLFDVLLKWFPTVGVPYPIVTLPPPPRLKEVEGEGKMLEILLLRATNNSSIF